MSSLAREERFARRRMQAAAGRALFWCALAVCICTAVQLRRPVGAPGHAGEVCSRSRSCSVGRGQRCVMRIRGGQPDEGLGGDVICSTAVSDRGLLESPQDGSIDLSVLEELREESMMRLSKMCDAEIGAMLHKRKRGMLEEEGKILQQKLHGSRSMPFPFPEIDYAANVGVNVSSLRSQQPRAHPGGVRLRECDEALLQEEDELYEAARKGDPAGAQKVDLENFYSADPRMQKQRRLARIKALLRCKAAAMTSEVMDQQALDGVEIPVFEMGNEQQRKNLRKLRDLFHPRSPSPEPPLSLRGATAHLKKCMPENESCVLHVRAEQGPLAGSPETQAEARTHPGTTPRLHQNTSAQQYGPYTPMEHPYLVVRGPNSSTLLYECEQGDLDEGLRIEGVRRVPRGLNENAPLHNVAVNGVDGWEGVEDRAGEAYKDKSDAGVLRARGKWKVMNMTLQTELMEAAEYGDYDGLSRALECGANLETGHNTPYTVSALHLAARGNHLGVIQLLLQHGQDANCEDYALATPLHYACDRGCLEAVQLLLCAGANLSRTDCYGRTALHRAAVEAPRRVARLLVDAGAHVDARDLLLDSPLHVAAIWGNEGVARLLVSHGARGDDFNRFGHCPVVLADTWERIVVAKFLRDHLRQIGAPEGYLSHMKPLRRPDELSVTPGFDREVAAQDLEELLRQQRGNSAASAVGSVGGGGNSRYYRNERKRPSAGAGPAPNVESLMKSLGLLHQAAPSPLPPFDALASSGKMTLQGMREEEERVLARDDTVCMGRHAEVENAGACEESSATKAVSGSGEGYVARLVHAQDQGAVETNNAAFREGGEREREEEEEEDMSDPYSVRYSKFWHRGGLSGRDLDEDWGYTRTGKKCSSGIEMVEPYFSVFQDDGLDADAHAE